MKKKQWIGVILIVVGAILMFFSHHIAEQVAVGRGEIARRQQQVNSVNKLFSGSETTKPIGELLTGSGQRRINEGIAEADYYDALAKKLQIGGIILVIIGIGFLVFAKKR